MAKRNRRRNPLVSGKNPAKVYLVAFPARVKKYRIAEKLYGREAPKHTTSGKGRVKNPNLPVTAISNNPQIFDDRKEGVLSRAAPLAEQIIADRPGLKPYHKRLGHLLDEEFRDILKAQKPVALLKKYRIPPLQIFYDVLGLYSYYCLQLREYLDKRELKEILAKITRSYSQAGALNINYIAPFASLDKGLLEGLSELVSPFTRDILRGAMLSPPYLSELKANPLLNLSPKVFNNWP